MQKIELLYQAVEFYGRSGVESEQLPLLRVQLAQLLDANQDAIGAEAMLRGGIVSTFKSKQAEFGSRMLVSHLGWFLMAHGRAPEAVALLTPYAAPSTLPPYANDLLTALAWAQNATGQQSQALTTLERIKPLPSVLPFSRPQQPIPVQLDIAATLKASHDPALDKTLQALSKRFTSEKQRQLYTQQLDQRAQFDPWQASRWKAHQEILRQLAL